MKKKLPFIILGVIVLIVLVVGLVFILNGNTSSSKQSKDLSVQYVGGDKFIGQTVTNDDFKVVYLFENLSLHSLRHSFAAARFAARPSCHGW